ncbi:MAG TPA: xanthine dehydrogenase accessory protein XdhC [Hydrogenophaga sp.]|nr:xanthine dehydrogenase accessory protein XdhC [Hydrogenophaga sp.]
MPQLSADLDRLLDRLRRDPAVLVTVARTRGSVPREVGAWMAVFADAVLGTIGGGHLEWDAERRARELLSSGEGQPLEHTVVLGPSLGQCCGGAVILRMEQVDQNHLADLQSRLAPSLWPVALFGGGHVGRAIVQALRPLPFAVTWIDSRDEVFPGDLSSSVQTEHSDPVQSAVRELVPGSQVLIMSFSHAEDLEVLAACLQRLRERNDLPFVGLIGSRTKWATFSKRLRQRGFDDAALAAITCPIGLPGIEGKQPAVIAASVAAQLLMGKK